MAHQLSIRGDGFVEMAYVGKVPWHRLGHQMKPDASKEDWRKYAGFDHEILSSPVTYTPGQETYTVADRMVMYRSDNMAPVGIVSTDYKIVQPSEVLDFFDDVVKSGNVTLETAGTLYGGKQYWALAKIGERAVLDTDKISGYLLLATSADGSRKTVPKLTCVRVVCNNTLRMSDNARYDTGTSVEVSHRSLFDADAIKKALGVAPVTFDEFMVSLDLLAKKKIRDKRAEELVETVFGEESRIVPRIMDLFHGNATGFDVRGFKGTTWGLVNSVTEYVDHIAYTKNDSNRISNSLLGKGDQRKRRAYELALEYATS